MTVFGLSELQASAAVLVCVIVLLILTGQLVPRRTMRDRLDDRNRHIEALERESRTWQRAYENLLISRHMADAHVGELMEVARATTQVLSSLPSVEPEALKIEVSPDATAAP
jgi:hypothetical protein